VCEEISWEGKEIQPQSVDYGPEFTFRSAFHIIIILYVPVDITCLKEQHTWMKSNSSFFSKEKK
jgi:hypothetical protein